MGPILVTVPYGTIGLVMYEARGAMMPRGHGTEAEEEDRSR